jgi:hypothetical protein
LNNGVRFRAATLSMSISSILLPILRRIVT